MHKKIIALALALYTAVAAAATDVNRATQAQLENIKGIGPAISRQILEARKKGDFKDWQDFITRVPGVAEIRAERLSGQGLSVNGMAYQPAGSRNRRQGPARADTNDAAKARP